MNQPARQDIEMNAAELYREDTFTDNQIGAIKRLTPVNADGSDDPSRPVEYIGSTQIMTPAGALPLSFELPGESLAEAIAAFGAAAHEAVERTLEELKEMQRQAASQIVVPKGGMGGGGMGGMGGGGIQIP